MADPLPPMPTPPRPPAPAPALDRAAVERVLTRAAALQGPGVASAEGLTEAELVEVAREAGIPVENVRLALLEERVRAALPATEDEPRGLAYRLAGPARVAASRVVGGTPAGAMEAITRFLERDACMRAVRRLPDRGTWEPRRDLVGNLSRALGRGEFGPVRGVACIGAAVLPLEDGRVLVRLEADVAPDRRQRLTVGGVTAAAGLLAGATVLGVGAVAHTMIEVLLPLATIPAASGGAAAWALARGHRTVAARAHASLEQLLDLVEHAPAAPPPRPSPLRDLLDGVRRSLG